MRHIHLLVEGQTEETVANLLIKPYLESSGCYVTSSILLNKRVASAPASRGGVSKWSAIQSNLRNLLGNPQVAIVTTLFDYYAFPADAPGMSDRPSVADPYARVAHVEDALSAAIGDTRFVPHLVLHETEAWVMAAGEQLARLMQKPRLAREIADIVAHAGGPERVNDGPDTAPSKHLLRLFNEVVKRPYQKASFGPSALRELRLDELRKQCPHLDEWLTTITS